MKKMAMPPMDMGMKVPPAKMPKKKAPKAKKMPSMTYGLADGKMKKKDK